MRKIAFAVCLIGLLIGSTLGGLALADKGGEPNYGSSPLGEIEELSEQIGNITDMLDNPEWGLYEIKREVSNIEGNITSGEYGLAEIKSEIEALVENIGINNNCDLGNITDQGYDWENWAEALGDIKADVESQGAPPLPDYGDITAQGYDWEDWAEALGDIKDEVAGIETSLGNITDTSIHGFEMFGVDTFAEAIDLIFGYLYAEVSYTPKLESVGCSSSLAPIFSGDLYDSGAAKEQQVSVSIWVEGMNSNEQVDIGCDMWGYGDPALYTITEDGFYRYEFETTHWNITPAVDSLSDGFVVTYVAMITTAR